MLDDKIMARIIRDISQPESSEKEREWQADVRQTMKEISKESIRIQAERAKPLEPMLTAKEEYYKKLGVNPDHRMVRNPHKPNLG